MADYNHSLQVIYCRMSCSVDDHRTTGLGIGSEKLTKKKPCVEQTYEQDLHAKSSKSKDSSVKAAMITIPAELRFAVCVCSDMPEDTRALHESEPTA
jgi:hypothetical protein